MAIEAPTAEVLGFLGCGIVGVLHRKTCVRGEVGHSHTVVQRGRGWSSVKGSLRGDHERCAVLEFNGRTIIKLSVGVVGRSRHGRYKGFTAERGGLGGEGNWVAVHMVLTWRI